MGKHSKPSRGKHRAPAVVGNTARAVAVGSLAALAIGVAAPAQAEAAEFDRDAIIACESGGDFRAENPTSTASGGYQMIDSTWMSVRGSSRATHAADASVAEQHEAALRLFLREGYSPWNASRSCWSSKVNRASASVNAELDVSTDVAVVAQPERARTTSSRATSSKQAARSSSYTVQPGDTLSVIALAQTGSADWGAIHRVNLSVIGADPHLILPGTKLAL